MITGILLAAGQSKRLKNHNKLLKKFPSNIRIKNKLSRLNDNEIGICNKNLDYLTFDQLRILFEKGSFTFSPFFNVKKSGLSIKQ